MSRKPKDVSEMTENAMTELADVGQATVDKPRKKRTVRYWLVRVNAENVVTAVSQEYKSRAKAEAFLDAVAFLGADVGGSFRVLKGKLL